MREAALYPAVKRFLTARGFEAKGEVGGCDVVGVRDGEPPVLVIGEMKLGFTLVSLVLLNIAGRRILPGALPDDMLSFTAAVMLGTLSILSLGFVLASIVPTARFAQPLGAVIMYPMLAISGLFFPVEVLPRVLRVVAYALPTTHAVALMQGVWDGTGWIQQMGSVGALLALFALCIGLSARWFRWE